MGLRHDSKIDPTPIIKGHFAAFAGNNHKGWVRDLTEQIALPAVGGFLAWFFGFSISAATGAAILTVTGLFAAFLFQLSIQLLDRSATWSESHPAPGQHTSEYASLLEELSANTAYAVLVAALTLVAAFGASIAQDGWAETFLTSATVVLLLHLATTLLLVFRRVFLFTRARLVAARTGTTQGDN
ncbi:MAG TPA: hypothetical protein ENI86_08970 [Acidimicrobiales bacterium]|nr:hypothetical protein [Acidimicrobiales bacterium]